MSFQLIHVTVSQSKENAEQDKEDGRGMGVGFGDVIIVSSNRWESDG